MNDYSRTAGQAVSTRSSSGGVESAAVQVPQSSALLSGIMERLSGLSAQAERLEALADRIVGLPPAEPKTDGVRNPAPMPSHVTGRLDVCIEAIDHIDGRVRQALIRLERFA